MKIQSLALMTGLTLAVTATAQPEKAAAINLVFNNPVQANNTSNVGGFGQPGVTGTLLEYRNVAPGIDARVTAAVSGTSYNFAGHIPNYTSAGNSNGDDGFVYQATQAGSGIMTYKFDFYQTDGTTHSFSTLATPFDFSLLVYDIDGEATQSEALRVSKRIGSSGLGSYQIGNSSTASLTATESATNYLFSGRGINVAETSVNGDVILNFLQSNSTTLQFESTTAPNSTFPNGVFSGIDGDLSILPRTTGTFAAKVTASQQVPEPFTIIGTIVGGTTALRMRKKLKSTAD